MFSRSWCIFFPWTHSMSELTHRAYRCSLICQLCQGPSAPDHDCETSRGRLYYGCGRPSRSTPPGLTRRSTCAGFSLRCQFVALPVRGATGAWRSSSTTLEAPGTSLPQLACPKPRRVRRGVPGLPESPETLALGPPTGWSSSPTTYRKCFAIESFGFAVGTLSLENKCQVAQALSGMRMFLTQSSPEPQPILTMGEVPAQRAAAV